MASHDRVARDQLQDSKLRPKVLGIADSSALFNIFPRGVVLDCALINESADQRTKIMVR
ncbi:MAG: hypothetical protein ABJN26_12800 [Stappiaceae bacterium]